MQFQKKSSSAFVKAATPRTDALVENIQSMPISLVVGAAATCTRRLISVRSSIPVLILAILGCSSSPSFSQQGDASVPSAATSEPAVQKAAVGKHLILLSGQSNMVGLDPDITFTPNVMAALGKDAVIIVKDAHGGQSIRSWCKPNLENPPPTFGRIPKVRGELYGRLMIHWSSYLR